MGHALTENVIVRKDMQVKHAKKGYFNFNFLQENKNILKIC
jgi:hypothetical protein